MFQWIGENAGTIVGSLLLVALVAWIVIRMRKDRKQGEPSCGCHCECCPMAGSCHKQS